MKKIIVTLGPASIDQTTLKIAHQDNYIYRINGTYNDKKSIKNIVGLLRKQVFAPEILLDLPGNKIRTTKLAKPITVEKGKEFILKLSNTNFPGFIEYLKKDKMVYADDSTLTFKIIECNSNEILFYSYSDGILKNGKGLHIRGIHSDIPFIFDKDLELIDVANLLKLNYIGLSFVRDTKDIDSARKKIDQGISILPKIETLSAVKNVDSILENSDHIIVDRGDLSTDIGIGKVALYQNYIVQKALYYNKPIYLATQFLKNMELNPLPTIAEVIDLHNTFKMGVIGIQLSEETAIGKYPQECLDIINMLLKEINKESLYIESFD